MLAFAPFLLIALNGVLAQAPAGAAPAPPAATSVQPLEDGPCLDSSRSVPRVIAAPVSRAMQIEEVLREGSTDSNVPMNLGIPAITISGGGAGTGAHSLNETFTAKDSWRGTQRALLLVLALAR